MKMFRLLKVLPVALVMILASTEANFAQVPSIQIRRKLPSDPLVLRGQSEGSVKSNCGHVGTEPNQIIQVTEALPYLRLTVEGPGKPTLFIDGPDGRFCVLADSYSGSKAELSGFWQPGRYLLHIGNLSPGQYNYNLLISQEKLPNSSNIRQSR
ncbi:hypothetical protein [Anabaena subtropica]|uniref:Uncharacterized protein n=1 Tax=Anabaena subtropica FACHB-260 TaxID=2692884 RepID=A0ABR8CSW3_9NOST|nr:hypothetical protein [Anabaena subtropica]MBD2345881.1 hypothetical protein [Anabaena subtropica FACHB-260]